LPSKCFWSSECNKQHWAESIVPGQYDVRLLDGNDAGAYLYGTGNHYLPANETPAHLAAVISDASQVGESIFFDTGLVGIDGEALTRQEHTSMHPRATGALFRVVLKSFEQGWQPSVNGSVPPEPDRAAAAIRAADVFRAAFPDSGSYMNTGSFFEPNWQRNEWGHHYARLLEVKQTVDPKDLFVCHHCVGSEPWSEDGFCRRSYPPNDHVVIA